MSERSGGVRVTERDLGSSLTVESVVLGRLVLFGNHLGRISPLR